MAEAKNSDPSKINPAWLKGLRFRSHKRRTVDDEGRKTVKYEAQERPAQEKDVLAFRDYGDRVVLVLADGQKVSVEQTGKKATAE